MSDLKKDIEAAINRASRESRSDTPDFVLALYLMNCLAAFEVATMHRDRWAADGSRGEVGGETMTENEIFHYHEGRLAELYKWAWHKDGVMYVGCGVRTYAETKREIEAQREIELKKLRETKESA